ncbi:hypothetical protein [Vibrio vulnificus]|uniref:hypothetical protein n=1 Tax=Vibrio vulnificus TaxID=672 RepID=UPI0001591E68|nr:hypothetical protein [Vibrio vulnificus]EGR0352670.1 hypothetical protein [Vibrio vulnificus]EGR0641096.1 hypothetical protein [Vibrio vulnificus]EGR0650226.1 hypothetical protein [Vibrio vulnificus]EGR7964522.1 hypothetical protein [Vibrio vulnificus]EGR7987487.1 hypothetical protein [Vibrio vulnificus]
MRETKSFSEDSIDIEELANVSSKPKPTAHDIDVVMAVAQQSSFSSRGDNKKKVRKRSPYVIQKNIKMRIGMPELLLDVTEAIKTNSDQETLERALLALIEKEGLEELKSVYMSITKDS